MRLLLFAQLVLMPPFFASVWSGVLDALFPPRCAGCRAFCRACFCPRCDPSVLALSPPYCLVCADPFDPLARHDPLCATCRDAKVNFDCARAAWMYEGAPSKAIHRLKYKGKSALAARLAPALARTVRNDETLKNIGFNYVTPVPLHPRRERKRGFNQSELLARSLARELEVPFQRTLNRTRATPPQVGLGAKDRAQNVRDAFALAPRFSLPLGTRILLVDDVLTTGATLRECAAVLKRAGAETVCAVTLVRHSKPDLISRFEEDESFEGLFF